MLPLRALGRIRLLVAPDAPWFVAAHLNLCPFLYITIISLCPCLHMAFFSVCVCVCIQMSLSLGGL